MILSLPLWEGGISSESLVIVGSILLVPGGIDGITQMFGERESNNILRAITGLLLGFGVVTFLHGTIYITADFLMV